MRKLFVTFGFASAFFATTEVVSAQDVPDVTEACTICAFRKTLFEDTRYVFTKPVRWDGRDWRSVTRSTLIVVGAMALADDSTRDYAQDHRNSSSERIADTFEPFGAKYAAGILLGYALVGKFADSSKARQTALDGTISTIVAAGLVVPALKNVTGRSRPRTDQGASDFHVFNGGASFPSGHTAAAFALATSIAENSDRRWVKDLSYGVAGLVGFARIEHDAHWLSDTMAGALIGIGVAKSVSAVNRERRGLAVSSALEPGGWGIAFSKTF